MRELAEEEGFRRVGFDRGDGWRRLGSGPRSTRGCSRSRRETHAAYRAEVHLQARDPRRGLDGRPDRPPGRLPRARGRPLADRGVQVDEPVGRRRAALRLRLRAGPPAAARPTATSGGAWATRSVSGALVYVDIETGEEVSIDVALAARMPTATSSGAWRGSSRSGGRRTKIRERKARAAGAAPLPAHGAAARSRRS